MRSVQFLVVVKVMLVKLNSRVQAPVWTDLMHGTANIGPGTEA